MSMFCTHCGKKNSEQASFCFSCGGPLAVGQSGSIAKPASHEVIQQDLAYRRPGAITLLAVLQFIGAAVWLLIAIVGGGAALASNTSDAGPLLIGCVILAGLGILQMACGVGLWKLKSYGRTLQLVLAWIGLLGFPVGTIVSIVILVYLSKPGIKILFSGTPASQLTPEQWAHVGAVTQSSMGGTVLAAVAIVFALIIMIGIVAAIAVPGLLRARMAGNEASAIGSLRAINSAQARYSQKCNGYAPSLVELSNAGGFLSSDLAGATTVTKNGYNVRLEPAREAVRISNAPPGCTGAVTDYFANAEPVTVGGTGTRYFASDARGTIFHSAATIANPIGPTASPIQ